MAEAVLHQTTSSAKDPEVSLSVPRDNEDVASSSSATPVASGFQAVNARSVELPSTMNSPSTATQEVSSRQSPATTSAAPPSAGLGDAIADSSTYGTRSRRNNALVRPNYSEDREVEFEMSSTTNSKSKKGTTITDPTTQSSHSDSRRPSDVLKFLTGNTQPDHGADSTPPRHSTPAASAAPPSKKRKATTAGPAPSQSSPATTTATTSQSRKSHPSIGRESNVMTFNKTKSCLNKREELIADDGTKLCVNDHVYLVCEPPGDPYYLCRIMEFLHVESDNPNSPVDALRVNWYYRPRDVQRFNSDSRLVYGTMHSDICPITSLRGRCTIKHRSEIEDLDAYRKERESFYFVQVFDRFIRRWYECIPVSQIINVPEKVKKALDERWKFVVVETGRVKELTSAVKLCKRCTKYCASNDSVDCAICKTSYHMNCVQPPLPKKPSRGFAWACGPCSRATERQQEARNTPTVSGDNTEADEEIPEEDEIPEGSNGDTRAPSPSGSDVVMEEHPATQAEIALANMWPMRYLGIHCRVEDALQYDDRAIYPRASSRLGPRHQANTSEWYGRSVELVKPIDTKKRYGKSGSKKDGKLSKEVLAALEAEREERANRPKWVQDEPPGYIARGEDYPADDPRCTARLNFKMPDTGPPADSRDANGEPIQDVDTLITDYVRRASQYARNIGVPPFGVNFVDKALELLTDHHYNVEAALTRLRKVDRVKDLHEPVLSKTDLAKFEEGVAKYGSEHRLVRLHMKTHLTNADIVRFYYLWKKTPKGRQIWGSFGGRKGSKRKLESDSGARLHAEVADDADDSAFDHEKPTSRNRTFLCKFCHTTHSRQWRRAPGVPAGQLVSSDGKSGNKDTPRHVLALCLRCAGLWRKYAIQWEDVDEVAKKVGQSGGRAWKKRIDEELLRELIAANEAAHAPPEPPAVASIESGEPSKKRAKTDKDSGAEPPKKKEKPPPPPKDPTPPPPPIVPVQPTWKILPCAVCRMPDDTISCEHCRLTVHRRCFGLAADEGTRSDGSVRWLCEQCQNDRNPQVSTQYSCCLCLTEETPIDLVEPPRVSHKKKTDRDREKERLEKELADAMRAEYRAKQLSHNRPFHPREPLKRTTGNNWVHAGCAIWTPEIRFSNSAALEVAEGFQLIPPARFEAVCKLCKNKDHQNRTRDDAGACVSCFQCQANVHASCAFEAGYTFGFDVTPVKGSRKDLITTARLGEETGAITAAIWCKEHTIKTIVHPIHEIADESGKTALQVYVENYKQADLTLTGTVRKANLAQLTKEKVQSTTTIPLNGPRRESTANSIAAAVRRGARTSSGADAKSEDGGRESSVPSDRGDHQCIRCNIDVTPRWHLVEKEASPPRKDEVLPETTEVEPSRSHGPDITGAPAISQSPYPSSTANSHGSGHFHPASTNGDATRAAPPDHQHGTGSSGDKTTEEDVQDYMCHKCFLKKKLHPTPPPQERPPPAPYSPPRQYPVSHDWNHPTAPPSNPPTYDLTQSNSQPRLPWNEPHRSIGQPPPNMTPVNGISPTPTYGLPAPQPTLTYGPPSSYAPQTNGFHGAPPPSHAPHAPPHVNHGPTHAAAAAAPHGPSHAPHTSTHAPPPPPPHSGIGMHERHHSYGYPGPPAPVGYQPHPSPIVHQYPQPNQPLANGAPSHSPTYPAPPHSQYPSRHPEPPYANSPGTGNYLRTETSSGPGGPLPNNPIRPDIHSGRPMTPHEGPRNGVSASHEGPRNGVSAPHEGPRNGVSGTSAGGASASPSLRNLLH